MAVKADTYEGPHLQACGCGLSPNSHYYLVDERHQRICPIPLYTQGMVREAIARYGDGWNRKIRAHLEGNLAGSGLPEYLEGMECQSLDDAISQWERSKPLRDAISFGSLVDDDGRVVGGFLSIPMWALIGGGQRDGNS